MIRSLVHVFRPSFGGGANGRGLSAPATWAAVLVGLTVLCGCEGAGWPGWTALGAADDVVAIRQFYNPLPWLRDADGRIMGMYTRVYLVSSRTAKGAFGSGPITVTTTRLRPRAEGGYDREPLHDWTFDEQAARGFRVVKTSKLGDSYGFVLRWPPDLDLMGRRIEVTFHYRRADGRMIDGPARQMWVPVPPGFPMPAERAGAPAPEPASAASRPSPATQRGTRPP